MVNGAMTAGGDVHELVPVLRKTRREAADLLLHTPGVVRERLGSLFLDLSLRDGRTAWEVLRITLIEEIVRGGLQ